MFSRAQFNLCEKMRSQWLVLFCLASCSFAFICRPNAMQFKNQYSNRILKVPNRPVNSILNFQKDKKSSAFESVYNDDKEDQFVNMLDIPAVKLSTSLISHYLMDSIPYAIVSYIFYAISKKLYDVYFSAIDKEPHQIIQCNKCSMHFYAPARRKINKNDIKSCPRCKASTEHLISF